MKRLTYTSVAVLVVAFLSGCGSMHPPSSNPYYAGYHARDAEEVADEYDDWEREQLAKEQELQREDSLRAVQDSLFRANLDRASGSNPYVHNQYQVYGDLYTDSYRFRPYHHWYPSWGWHRPYYRSDWYRPYWRRHSGLSLSFSYSNMPYYVNTWWADDYMWDRYFWYDSYYSDPYFSSPYHYSGYYGSYYSPYYGYWYDDHSRRVVVDKRSSPQVQRPRNRDGFTRSVSASGTSQSHQTTPQRSDVRERVRRSAPANITPAVIDREALQHREIETRNTYRRIQERTLPRSQDSNSREARPVKRRSTEADRSSSSSRSSHSATSRSSRSSQSRSFNSSSSSNKSSGSSSNSSQRSRNRKQKQD